MIGAIIESVGAFAIVVGAICHGFNYKAKAPVYVVWGGLIVMVVGIFS